MPTSSSWYMVILSGVLFRVLIPFRVARRVVWMVRCP